jgi:hypothetical protein
MGDPLTENRHPLGITDRVTTMIRGEADDGIKESWSKIVHKDEVPDEETASKSEGLDHATGGGINPEDIGEVYGENVDPELEHLRNEYLIAVDSGYGKPFDAWLKDEKERETPTLKVRRYETKGKDRNGKKAAFSIVRPESKPDPDTFNLIFNKVAFDRLTKDVEGPGREEADKNRAAVNSFYENWTSFNDDIEAIGFGTQKGKLESIIMQLKKDKNGNYPNAIEVPIEVFRRVFGINPHKGKRGEIDGIEIGWGTGERGFINPYTSHEILEKLMARLSIDGVKLDPSKVDYQILGEELVKMQPVEGTIFAPRKVQV